ncbi:MAG: GAF domain-containing protein [Synechococcales cyanobacterium C42_A2020_086]|nr:GAF domain-containing protein [Synechococcales cyanobacterium C42_A2020_086]
MATHPSTPPLPHAFAAARSAVDGNGDLEQRLLRLLRDSQTAELALSQIAQAVGSALAVEQCIVGMGAGASSDGGVNGGICWSATLQEVSPLPANLLSCLQMLDAVEAPLLSISDVWDATALQPQWNAAGTVASLRQFPFRGILAVRTVLHGQCNGILLLLSTQPRFWEESEVQLLQTLAPQVAVTISQAQLEQQIQRQIQCQALIDRLTTAIRNNLDLNVIYQQAVAGVVEILHAHQGMLLLFKYADPLRRSAAAIPKARANVAAYAVSQQEPQPPTANALQGDAARPEAPTQLAPEPREADLPAIEMLPSFWASDCCLCQQMLLGQSQVVISTRLPEEMESSSGLATALGVEVSQAATLFALDRFPAMVMVPLENQGTVLGCLVVQYVQHYWLPEEVAFLKLVAAQLSTAIIQTRTLQQVQAVVKERTAQLQRSLEVQAKLYEKTRQQVEQLRRLNEEREEFLSTVSHELLTPLTSMTLAIRMLRQADLPPERRTRYLDILEQQCVQETNLINDLLALRKLESNPTPLQLQKLDVGQLIRNLVQSMETIWAEADLTFALNLPTQALLIYTEAESLNRIVLELLTNARKYSTAGSLVRLCVEQNLQHSTHPIEITVHNVGAGIPAAELPFIFDKFRRCQGVTKQAIQGTGLGLALVKGLVQHLGGSIEATSSPIEHSTFWETCFTLRLPQCPEGAEPTIA